MTIRTATFAERPDLARAVWGHDFRSGWPDFIAGDLMAEVYYERFFHPSGSESTRAGPFSEYALVAYDVQTPGEPLARAFSAPFFMGDEHGRPGLPDGGWDQLVAWADDDLKASRPPNAVGAIEVNVRPDARGHQLSTLMLAAMRANAARLGFCDLYAPVRPSQKHLEPHTQMEEYAYRTREDGLPYDPWLRVHVRTGGQIVRVAPASMTVAGSLEQWRGWTGLALDTGGEWTVPGALIPVQVSVRHGYAVYTEPNVWVHHRI